MLRNGGHNKGEWAILPDAVDTVVESEGWKPAVVSSCHPPGFVDLQFGLDREKLSLDPDKSIRYYDAECECNIPQDMCFANGEDRN